MRKLTLLIILILPLGFIATKFIPFTPPPVDQQVIKFNDVAYDGKRLYIGPVSTNSDRSELKFTISNTGRRDIRLGGGFDDIVINLDPSFNNIGSQSEIKNIVETMLSKKKFITAGTVLTGQVMDLSSKMLASKTPKETASKSKTSSNKKKSSRPEAEKIDMGNGTTVLETPEKENSKRSKFLDPDDCPDLVIKDIEILKVNKYMIAIEYTVKNQGTGTAEMHGSKKNSVDDNMFLKAYLSATPKFSRSATTIGETAVRKEMDNKDGTLDKSREFKGKMYMNVRGRTNLTPYLILTLDPYQTVRECNERNNRSYIKIEE